MSFSRALAVVLFVAPALPGCWAETDRAVYVEGQPGVASLSNGSSETLWLPGCIAFEQQRWDGGAWVPAAVPDWVCFWEGYAQPLEPRETHRDPFTARTPGRWRIEYTVGHGCDPERPLRETTCQRIEAIHSNEYRVIAANSEEALCSATGGRWDPTSCGHYDCGKRPLCAAVIPGCDCGPGAVFVDGVGCLAAPCGAPPDAE